MLTATSGVTASLAFQVKKVSLKDLARLHRVGAWLPTSTGGRSFFVQACAALYGGTPALPGEDSIWAVMPNCG